jgi:uncharacterized membrane-anchored protein YitT (DUF2179 family)
MKLPATSSLSTLAGAFLFFLTVQGINWLYQFHDANTIFLRAIIAGGISGLALSLVIKPSALLSRLG